MTPSMSKAWQMPGGAGTVADYTFDLSGNITRRDVDGDPATTNSPPTAPANACSARLFSGRTDSQLRTNSNGTEMYGVETESLNTFALPQPELHGCCQNQHRVLEPDAP